MYKHPEIDYQPQHPQYYEPKHLHFMNSEKGKFKKLAKRASKAAKKAKSKVKKAAKKVKSKAKKVAKKVKSKVKKAAKEAAKSLEDSDSDCECKK